MDIVVLNMVFDNSRVPDFGNITINKNGDFVLLQEDVFRLVTNLTRDVCGAAFNVPVGQRAVVIDTGAVFVYHANDRWYLNEPRKFYSADTATATVGQTEEWKNPERYHAGYVDFKLQKDSTNYLLNDETVTLTVTDGDNNVITEQTITNSNYMGDGYYVAWLNILEARKLKNLSVTNIDIEIKNGSTDITNTFDIPFVELKEWVDEIKYGE